MSVAEAVNQITSTKQLVLFRLSSRYYIKVDSMSISVEAACFCDAVEFLVKLYYVLDLKYEHELKLTFGFFEKLLKIPVSVGGSTLSDFVRIVMKD